MKFFTVVPALLAAALAAPAPSAEPVEERSLVERATAKTLVTQTLYDTLVRYAVFAKAASTQPCKNPPFQYTLVQEFSVASTDTQASIYKSATNKEIIVTFRGSTSLQDAFTDALVILTPFPDLFPKCSTCQIHFGFANAFRSILPSINSTLAATVKTNPDYKITIVGGSLGGALAKLGFTYFKASSAFGAKVSAGYSYGEPRVGDAAFANYVDGLAGAVNGAAGIYYRTTHANDIVPQSPPPFGYRHSSTEYWEKNQPSTGKPSAASTYRCYGQEPYDCNNSQFSLPDGATAHTTYPGYEVAVCPA